MRVISLAAAGIACLGLSALPDRAPRIVWNPSASAPVGLYLLTHAEPRRSDLVLVNAPPGAAKLAAERGYLPANVPLVKRIVGLSGDHICAETTSIVINGKVAAKRLLSDSHGRQMPVWSGCRDLGDEVFLLMTDVPSSFDSRYFGPVPRVAVLGKLTPLWIRP